MTAKSACGRIVDLVLEQRRRLADACDELAVLKRSWAYAFAYADSCGYGDSPQARETRRRVEDLRALISELTP